MRIRVIDGVPMVRAENPLKEKCWWHRHPTDGSKDFLARPLDDRPEDREAREAWAAACEDRAPMEMDDGLYETMREFVGCPDGTHRLVLRRVELVEEHEEGCRLDVLGCDDVPGCTCKPRRGGE